MPATKGDPGTGVKAPVTGSMMYPVTLPEPVPVQPCPDPQFAIYANRPLGSMATSWGCDPAAKGEAAMGVNAPVFEFMLKTETSSEPKLAV